MPGPAPGRPAIPRAFVPCSSASSSGALRMDRTSSTSPAAAVPVRMKIPVPMMAPMPSAVSDHGPNVFRS